MRINNNLMAMNTHRQLGVVTEYGAKATEKLSSGYRINRAGDDAAGLAISEKMRGQIRGLNQASRNAQDGISLIQTAEGALNETHAILQRMRELAVQSATDTNTDVDRGNIQDEIDQLATEITRISEQTEFNTMKLLDGKFEDKVFHIGANENQNTKLSIEDMSSKALKVAGNGGPLEEVANGEYLGVQATKVYKAGDDVVAVEIGGKLYAAEDVIKTAESTPALAVEAGTEELVLKDGVSVNGKIVEYRHEQDAATGFMTEPETGDPAAIKKNVLKDGDDIVAIEISGTWYAAEDVKLNAAGTDLEGKDGAVALEVNTAAKYIDGSEGGLNVSDQKSADKAITTINDALETVSKERSKLGAMQNRLEHTIKNLDTSAENLQASESRIRDVDMAQEMMEFTKQNILQQASTAMLAQANVAPQSVLQLLQ